MSNKKDGTDFENKVSKILGEHGFWSHVLADKKSGQPFDIIACRNGDAYAIDAKMCENDYFQFSRIESNQKTAQEFWNAAGNGDVWYALGWSDGTITMLKLPMLIRMSDQCSRIWKEDAEMLGRGLFAWMADQR